MQIQQFYLDGLAQMSYLIGDIDACACAIVDPHREVERYLNAAHASGFRITHIIETHLHSDFVSGARELAARTGAPIYLSVASDASYPYVPLNDGDNLRLGYLDFKVLATPGHTPEHVCLAVADTRRSDAPNLVLTGDTLFVGDVGRPDLVGDETVARSLAGELYSSLFDRLLQLPDYVEVYPGHGQGSPCGRNIASKRTTTIGFERRFNPSLQVRSVEEFVSRVLAGQPPVPAHWQRIKAVSRHGPTVLGGPPRLEPLPPDEVAALIAHEHFVVDVREPYSFGGAHVPGAQNIWLSPHLTTWASWLVPGDRPLILVAERPEEARDAARWLTLVGFDRFSGYLEGGMDAWHNDGQLAAHIPQMSVPELRRRLEEKDRLVLLDVRTEQEWSRGHVDGALHIPLRALPDRLNEVPRDRTIATSCSSGHRASVAASFLQRHGFERMVNILGGMNGWFAAGYPIVVGQVTEAAGSRVRVPRHQKQRRSAA